MQLADVPNNTRIRVLPKSVNSTPPGQRPFIHNEELLFAHCDGMYSLCYDVDQQPVHLSRFAEVEIIKI